MFITKIFIYIREKRGYNIVEKKEDKESIG
jgi:hypothetical protein